jgi:beta-glucosidase
MSFLWGVSTSPFQHEGGFNGPTQPRNNWGDWEEAGRVERVGRAADFWNRYDDDFALAAGMGLTAFRLGISWSRIQPSVSASPSAPPDFSQEALAHYGKMIIAARKRGLEPLLTLSHFTHPAWLGKDPWLDPATPARFTDFAVTSLTAINTALEKAGLPAVRWILTINEPNMLAVQSYLTGSFPSGPRRGTATVTEALQTMLLAHVRTYRALHDLYRDHPSWGAPRISINNYASDVYWADKVYVDILTAPSRGIRRRQLFPWLLKQHHLFEKALRAAALPLNHSIPYWIGQWIKRKVHRHAIDTFQSYRLEPLLDLLYDDAAHAPLDYIAIDYYDPFIGNAFRFPRFQDIVGNAGGLRNWLMNSVTAKCWDWPALPQGLGFFLRHYAKELPGAPLVIAENGMARMRLPDWTASWRRDKLKRSEFIRRHLEEVQLLRKEGLPLEGYFHWSLTDNYEWGSYAARFGLHRIDFRSDDLAREPVDTFGDNAAETYSALVRQDRSLRESNVSY